MCNNDAYVTVVSFPYKYFHHKKMLFISEIILITGQFQYLSFYQLVCYVKNKCDKKIKKLFFIFRTRELFIKKRLTSFNHRSAIALRLERLLVMLRARVRIQARTIFSTSFFFWLRGRRMRNDCGKIEGIVEMLECRL